MDDPIIIPINKKKLGAAAQAVFCVSAGFIPFVLGAALLLPVGGIKGLQELVGAYLFFLLAAFLVFVGFMKDAPDD